jgi:hypothetical protein
MSDDKEFREKFPALTEELTSGDSTKFRIDGVRTMSEEPEEEAIPESTYMPDVVDYIRRCDTLNQAMEIIDWMVKQGELPLTKARDIKRQLKSDGLRSFGSKKEKDHYLRHGLE